MEIGQVEAFLAVGTFGGFRRAAEALRLTQPAISARIRALEQSLGVELFARGQGVALSPAGRAFRPHAEQLLQTVALARQAVHDLRPTSAGAIPLLDGLKQHLKRHLPDYMIPHCFELIDAMPLTPSGKADRQALPEPVIQGRP